MIYFSNAKINIGLYVLGKRNDGYHNIQSVLMPIGLSDVLEVSQGVAGFDIEEKGLIVGGNPTDNLIYKAYNLLKPYFSGNLSVSLYKNIPFGAGLGGGSSNAAFTAMGINHIFDLGLSDNFIKQLLSQVGADCPFFVTNAPSFVTETGTTISELSIAFDWVLDYTLVLLKPNFSISTKQAYAGVSFCKAPDNYLEILQQNPSNWKGKIINSFEYAKPENSLEIEQLKKFLYTNGACYASMSGSGSSIYGFFKNHVFKANREKFISHPFYVWAGKLGVP